LLCLKLQYG